MYITKAQNFTLYIFLFFINFQELKIFNLDYLSIPKLSAFIYLLTILPQFPKFFSTKRIKPFLVPIWLFFVLLTIVSLWNISKTAFSFFDFQLFQFIILFWIMLNHGRDRPRVLEKGMLILAFGSLILAIFYYFGIGIDYNLPGRISMFGDNENIIGLRMCISIIILSLAILQNKLELGKIRYLMFLAIPIMFSLLVATASRTAFLAFLLSIIVGIYFFPSKTNWRKMILIAMSTIFIVIIWPFLMQYKVLILRLLLFYEYGDVSNRTLIWEGLIPVIQNNPIFGIGKTGYFSLFGKGSPHNVFLEILCYTGGIGLLFYMTFLFAIFRETYRYMRRTGYLLPILLSISILSFLSSVSILK